MIHSHKYEFKFLPLKNKKDTTTPSLVISVAEVEVTRKSGVPLKGGSLGEQMKFFLII